MTPDQYFTGVDLDFNSLLHLGIIVIGIVACVAIAAMVVKKK